MKRLLTAFFWYIFGWLIARNPYYRYVDWDDERNCPWCGGCIEEEMWCNIHSKVLSEENMFNGENSGKIYEILVTCPKCFHETYIIDDTSP